MKEVFVFTDGSCLGNPGPGGYGVVLKYKNMVKELSNGYERTTNNRMEILAVVAALGCLREPCAVHITTDSQYVKNGISSWIHGWKRNGWLTSTKQPVKNVELWKQLDELVARHNVQWHWVKGHSGHAENERCDELARTAASGQNAPLQKDDTTP